MALAVKDMKLRILVCLKRVLDQTIPINASVLNNTFHIKHTINPTCANALETAVHLKENFFPAAEIITASVGDENCMDMLRYSLAFGATKSILLKPRNSLTHHDSLCIAQILHWYIKDQHLDVIFTGKQSTDIGSGHIPPMLAGLLGWRQSIAISDIKNIYCNNSNVNLTLLQEGMQYSHNGQVSLPAIISCRLGMNQPRFTTLLSMMRAKNLNIDIIDVPEDQFKSRTTIKEVKDAEKNRRCTFVPDAQSLLPHLRHHHIA